MFENIIKFGKRMEDAKYLADYWTGKIIRPLERWEIEKVKEYYVKVGNYLEIDLAIIPFYSVRKNQVKIK